MYETINKRGIRARFLLLDWLIDNGVDINKKEYHWQKKLNREVTKLTGIVKGKKKTFNFLIEAQKKLGLRGYGDFYSSEEWRAIRPKVFELCGRQCLCCGAKPPVELHVDHIKPRSKHPELELDLDNLQILCKDCNLGKSNKDSIDYRPK